MPQNVTDRPESPPDWEALGRYLAGECDAAETVAIRRWLETHPGDAVLLASLSAALDGIRPAESPNADADVDIESALAVARGRLHSADVLDLESARRDRAMPPRRSRRAAMLAVAALLVGAVLLRVVPPMLERAAPAEASYSTSVGERNSIRLGDSTIVVLGPMSHLTVSAMSDSARRVRLEGEAYFEIAPDRRPFTVTTDRVEIRDIGTAFSVRAHRGERLRVAVSTGAVSVAALTPTGSAQATAGDRMIRAGEAAELTDAGAIASTSKVTEADIAWTSGTLAFRDAPMTEVASRLRRWYGIELQIPDARLARLHFTGTFTREGAQVVLDAIAASLEGKLERRGDTVIVRSAR